MEKQPRASMPSNGGVKIGGLWKRSQGLSRFTRPNFKHRVFILTDHALSYYGGTVDRVGALKRRVDLSSVRAVEFVDHPAFNLAHTMQIVYMTKKYGFVTLYITATDKVECADWVSQLRQVCYFNQDMLMHYHPGALLHGHWSCCQQHGRSSLGCQPTYHLLTRSSSRYAQMRRKDTLTSSHRRRSRTSTTGSNGLNRAALSVDVDTIKSNSCMDLVEASSHVEGDRLELQMADCTSPRSSHLSSTDPSVSMGSITLTHVSVLESSQESGTGTEDCDAETRRLLCEPRLVQTWDRRTSRGRSKVAPEGQLAPLSTFPLDPEAKVSNQVRFGSESEVPARPATASFSGSASFIPSVPTITEKGEAAPTAAHMKHSKTFVVSTTVHVSRPRHLSSSTSALGKPTIDPHVSNSDPNVIHV